LTRRVDRWKIELSPTCKISLSKKRGTKRRQSMKDWEGSRGRHKGEKKKKDRSKHSRLPKAYRFGAGEKKRRMKEQGKDARELRGDKVWFSEMEGRWWVTSRRGDKED